MAKWKLPEGREPLLWKDMPFSERPKAHPSTERLEIEKLQERVAELEARVAKAREEALREAAEQVNRNLGKPAHHAHAAIIALIEKDQ